MTELQSQLLNMLLEIDTICRKHDITYYLVGGSALGAVRHHGFIPWDDDADIVMTRENWVKFENIIEAELPSNRKLLTWNKDLNYPAIFARYTNTETTCIVHSLGYSPIPWGLMIDIFVLSPLPNEEQKRLRYHQYVRDLGELVNPYFCVNSESSVARYIGWKILCKILGKKKVLSYIEKQITSYPEEECTHYSYGYPRVHVIYDKAIFQAPRYIPFEGHLLPVPTKAEEHFRILFGETWMYLPENQASEHRMSVDIKRPYNFYMADYYQHAPLKKINKAYSHWKTWRIKVQKDLLYCKHCEQILDFSFHQLDYLASFQEIREEAHRLFHIKELVELHTLLKPSLSSLYDRDGLENNLVFSLSNEDMFLMLYMLNYIGQFYKAERILQIYAMAENYNASVFTELEKLICGKKEFISSYYNGTTKELHKDLDLLLNTFPFDHTLLALKGAYLEKENLIASSKMLDIIQTGMEHFPEDGIFMKFHGDYLIACGQILDGENIYRAALNSTNNGLIRLEINDYFGRNT